MDMVITVLLLSRERADFRRKPDATFCSFLESSSSLFPRHFERRRVETVFIKKLDWEKSVQGPESKDKGLVQTKDRLCTVKIVKYKNYFKQHILSIFWHTLRKNLNYPNQKIIFSFLALQMCYSLAS